MTTTAKRRFVVGDKVRLLIDLQPYKAGNIAFIMGDDHSYTPYYCKFADNSFHWLAERFIELVDPVAPRLDPCVFGKAQVGVEPVLESEPDPLADVKAAMKAGKRVRCMQTNGTMGQWVTDTTFWRFHLPRDHYEIEPDPIPEPKIEWVLGDKYLTRGGETAVLVMFDKGARFTNRLVFLRTGQDHWVTDSGKNFPGQTSPHADDIVKHLKDKA